MSEYRGSIDRIENGIAYGWAAHTTNNGPISVLLTSNKEKLGSGVAYMFRQDLVDSNIHEGNHGFEIDISKLFVTDNIHHDDRVYDIALKVSDTKQTIAEIQINTKILKEEKLIKAARSHPFFLEHILSLTKETIAKKDIDHGQLLVDFILTSQVFDVDFYSKQTDTTFDSKRSAVLHFLTSDIGNICDPHPLFSLSFYSKSNPDVATAQLNPLLHFLVFGGKEKRDPSPLFKTEYYLSQLNQRQKKIAEDNALSYFLKHPKTAKPFVLYSHKFYEHQIGSHVGNALLDYLTREDNFELSLHSLFNVQYYIEQNGALNKAPFLHYLLEGNRNANIHPLFNNDYYLARHPEVTRTGLAPPVHYAQSGASDLYWPNPYFWPEYYYKQVSELNKQVSEFNVTYESTFEHYLLYGEEIGLKPNPWFDPNFYYKQYSFVKDAGVSALQHYIQDGCKADYLPSEYFYPKYIRSRYDVPKFRDTLHYYMEVITGKQIGPADAWLDDVPEFAQMDYVKKRLSNELQNHEILVSVIVPVYNSFSYTLRCIYSMLRSSDKTQYEIILADDLSSDDTESFFSGLKGIKYLRNQSNLGFLKSCNNAATKANGKYIFLLNNDTAVLDGWLDSLVTTFEIEPHVGLVGSKLIYPNGILQEAGGILWSNGAANYGKYNDPQHPDFNYLRHTDYVSGAAILIRKDLWDTLGGFDTRYTPAYCEDSDLCLAIRNMGFNVLYQPNSRVVHFEGISSGTDLNSGVKKYQVVNSKKLEFKWRDLLKTMGNSGDFSRQVVNRSSNARMLIIDATFPTPDQDAGSVTVWYFMKIFRSIGYQVTFLPQNLHYMSGYVEKLNGIGVECLYSPYIKNINEYIMENGSYFDVVMLYRVNAGGEYLEQVRKYAPKAKVIFDTVDLHFLRMEREALMEADIKQRTQKKILADETKYRELELLNAADISIVLSDYEKQMLSKEYGVNNTVVVPIVLESPGSEIKFNSRKDIAFIGGYQHTPNVDAVLYFVEELWPLVKEQIPGVKFYVIGSKPTTELLALPASDPDIVVTGFVESLDPFLNSLKLTIAPLRYGAGIKGKIGSSLSYGVPCIATKIAAEGMGLSNGVDILMSDTNSQFIEDLVSVYQDEARWTLLSQSGFKFVDDNYSIATIQNKLANMLNSLAAYPYKTLDPISMHESKLRVLEKPPTNLLIGDNGATLAERLIASEIIALLNNCEVTHPVNLSQAITQLSDDGIQIETICEPSNKLSKKYFENETKNQSAVDKIGLIAIDLTDFDLKELTKWQKEFQQLIMVLDGSALDSASIDTFQFKLHQYFSKSDSRYNIKRGAQGMLGENHLVINISKQNSTRIFVIGSTGFIGKNLMKHLSDRDDLDLFRVGREQNDVFIDLDTGTYSELVDQIQEGDYVVFLAAMSSPEACSSDPEKATRINVTHTKELLKQLNNKKAKVIYASSDAVFGETEEACFEESRQIPAGVYGQMKADVEEYILGLDKLTKIVRFSYVVGKGDAYTAMLEAAVISGEEIDVFEGFVRNVVALNDVLEGITALIQKWNETPWRVINFSGPEGVDRKNLTKVFSDKVLPDLNFKVVDAPKGFWDSRSKVIKMRSERFAKLLGRPATGLGNLFSMWGK